MIDNTFAALFCALCLLGAAWDIATRRIPNSICLSLASFGLLDAAWAGGWSALAAHGLFGIVALAGGAVLFAVRWIGAGDAKFFAGAATWFVINRAPETILTVSLAGVALFVAWFVYRRARGKRVTRAASSPEDQLPYGVAIAAGMIATLLIS